MKSVSFNDFSKLILKGSQNFCTYGEYVAKNRNTTKEQRKLMISYHYKNILKSKL